MDYNDIKRIDIKEFREKGYLQELNRRFLHPLGLALEILIDDEGNEFLGGVWDYRDDIEGIHFGITTHKNHGHNLDKMIKKKEFIDKEIEKRKDPRTNKLGSWIEPLGEDNNGED